MIAALRQRDLPPGYLRVEVTESAMMSDLGTAARLLGELRRFGVSVSIDDFGTGYSSLSYLKQMPVDELKLDRSFVKDLMVERVDAAIVRSAIEMGHAMGLEVLAEGVEDATTWARLRELGCDLAQGYYASRPLPADELLEWLRTASTDLARAA